MESVSKTPTYYKNPVSSPETIPKNTFYTTNYYTKRERTVIDPNIAHSPPSDFKINAFLRLASY